ncbi:MAG TPA: (deoxy)nucleoside triphosphate pyrophosphohydrolase [Burkholderiaceae bacterium]|nr:(deoxy)nucleoside triphosphate pyrophosphohydrolase [Burkholderiaceae bacterium]
MSEPLATQVTVVDPDVPRAATVQRVITEVAVGILINAAGQFLLTTRPIGKVYAGYWEFPGGKLEANETVIEALRRELNEEIGVVIQDAQLWRSTVMDYPHALVRLHFCKVTAWSGELQMHEQQTHAWQHLPVQVSPILAGALPVLEWLAAEQNR